MNIPFLDLHASYRDLQPELDSACRRILESGKYILGEEVEAFEREFADYCGSRHCVGVGNGLDALKLILRACRIGPGDEVIVPAHTFIATWLAVSDTGAVPVPVEPDPVTLNIDPERIPAALTDRTKAIIPVHLYGQPVDLDPIRSICRDRGIRVVEDAAQAHGARCRGRRVGGLGDAAAFSFYPAKNLGAFGDGGAVVTDDDELAEEVRLLRNYGSRVKYQHESSGVNSRLDPLQAAFLRVKLKYLDQWNDRRRAIAGRYLEALAGLPSLNLPRTQPHLEAVWHIFAVRHPRREELRQHLERRGIGTLIHYPVPPHRSGAYAKGGWRPGDFPLAEQIAGDILSLPLWPQMDPPSIQGVVAAIREFARD